MSQVPPDQLHLGLASSTRAPREARQALAGLLVRAGRTDLTDSAELLVDELVTNAVMNTDGPIVVTATYANGTLHVEVADCDSEPPILKQPQAFDETGRGIWLVSLLAASWASEPQATGKKTWFELT